MSEISAWERSREATRRIMAEQGRGPDGYQLLPKEANWSPYPGEPVIVLLWQDDDPAGLKDKKPDDRQWTVVGPDPRQHPYFIAAAVGRSPGTFHIDDLRPTDD
jgi:hypothetical protein